MKKQLLIISVMVVIVGIFVSCSANRNSEAVLATDAANEVGQAVTDSKDEKFTTESVNDFDATENEATSSANYDDYADTDVELSTTDFVATTTVVNSTTANSTTRHKADKKASVDGDGWINKWY
ncbi:hypothetical protein [Eubacterium sp.]|uniref:hypothetical protein n=1 Tax=Eubacterium sp. TaxID=142586 RepID=UPI003F0255DB